MPHQLTILPAAAEAFGEHRRRWRGCTKCDIGAIAHEHVFARGTLPCDVLFIGEAPGKTEDVVGLPFVGRAGKLLDGWIQYAQSRGQSHFLENGVTFHETLTFAITNLVLCRPTDRSGGPNRAPRPEELDRCAGRLYWFVDEIARPKGIVLLGKHAAENCMGRFLKEIPVLELVHPAYILRDGGLASPKNGKILLDLASFYRRIGNACSHKVA